MLNGRAPPGEGQNWDGGLLASSTRPESPAQNILAYIYMKVVCSICGVEDWPAQIRNWHGTGRCVSTVVDKPVVTNSLVTNSPDPVVTNKRSGNRHDKAAWRIYMREYMKAKRGRQA